MQDTNGNGLRKWKVRVDLVITIVGLIAAGSFAWAHLQARVVDNTEAIGSTRSEVFQKLEKIEGLLNDKDIGLPALNQRLKNLEKTK